MLWWKWLYWTKGICAKDFKNEHIKDVKDIMAINNVVKEKELREAKMNKMISNVRF